MSDTDLSADGLETKVAASGRPLGAISTLISLFLLLLVFFILLFSVAQAQRGQADKLLASIDTAFKGIPSVSGLMSATPRDPDSDNPAGFVRTVSQLITGFGAPTASQSETAPAGGALISLGVANTEIFVPGSAVLTPHAEAIALKLAVLLQRHPNATQHYHLRLHVPSVMGNGKYNESDSSFAQVASFAAALYRDGCQADRLTLSVGKSGDQGRVYFEFSLTGQPEDAA